VTHPSVTVSVLEPADFTYEFHVEGLDLSADEEHGLDQLINAHLYPCHNPGPVLHGFLCAVRLAGYRFEVNVCDDTDTPRLWLPNDPELLYPHENENDEE